MSIFKAYDIRGMYPEDINEGIAYELGIAFAGYLKNDFVIGRDTRISSPPLLKALSDGIMDSGFDVTDIGIVDTPALYFATAFYGFKAGVMITASHNPKGYNGFKICEEDAIPVGGDSGLKDIEKLFGRGKKSSSRGKLSTRDITLDYLAHLIKFYKGGEKRVVIDCSNGSTSRMIGDLMKKTGCETIIINGEMDGNFPAHEPNPLNEANLKQLRSEVLKAGADFGVCFDGDGDRLSVINMDGSIVRNDFLTAIMARELLKDNRNETVLYDLRSSRVVREEIERAGGKPLMCRVGHAFIKKQMREINGLFAGELSGHYYYRENFFADSAFITFLKLVDAKSIDTKGLERYFQSGEINVKVEDRGRAITNVETRFRERGKLIHLDGISVESGNFWFNIRPSNTEPLVRINVEAESREVLDRITEEIMGCIK